ncbi:hypothetical protein LZC95_41160 [Pendulispora brunnea]|uniref:Uncharacterized protein n=1 Tax=Pendulispora brunnea TaxID=2905690 RepID=A0ABZ2K2A4_9BACT
MHTRPDVSFPHSASCVQPQIPYAVRHFGVRLVVPPQWLSFEHCEQTPALQCGVLGVPVHSASVEHTAARAGVDIVNEAAATAKAAESAIQREDIVTSLLEVVLLPAPAREKANGG